MYRVLRWIDVSSLNIIVKKMIFIVWKKLWVSKTYCNTSVNVQMLPFFNFFWNFPERIFVEFLENYFKNIYFEREFLFLKDINFLIQIKGKKQFGYFSEQNDIFHWMQLNITVPALVPLVAKISYCHGATFFQLRLPIILKRNKYWAIYLNNEKNY